jgi:hypothetical protein
MVTNQLRELLQLPSEVMSVVQGPSQSAHNALQELDHQLAAAGLEGRVESLRGGCGLGAANVGHGAQLQ